MKNFLATHNIDMDSEVKSFMEKVGRNLEKISEDKDMSVHKKFKKSDALVTVRKKTQTIGSCSLDEVGMEKEETRLELVGCDKDNGFRT